MSVNVEDLLAREMGTVGPFQLRVVSVIMFNAIISALSTSEFVFTAARIPTRCLVPECENASSDIAYSPEWILNAIPRDGDGFDNCNRFANTTYTQTDEDTCPAALFDQSTIVGCESYIYENTNTAVYDLGLACDEWKRSFIGSLRTLGMLISLPIYGMVSDRFGRRPALTIAAFSTAWVGLLRYFATNYAGFMISVFVEAILGAGAGGMLSSGFILLMETIPAKQRAFIGTFTNTAFGLGQVTLGLLAWALNYWRHLTLVIYSLHLLTIFYLWLLPESIRWYLNTGRFKDAEALLKRVAKSNGTVVSKQTLLELEQAAEMRNEKDKEALKNNESEPWLIVLVFKHKAILLRCVVAPIWWITLTLTFYGLSINAVNISNNPYVSYIIVALIEIPGYWIAMVLIQRIGRKPVLVVSYWICAAGQIAYIFVPTGQFAASLTVYMVSKCAIASVLVVVYLYTMELFPTRYRQTLFAFCSMLGRVGSIVAPLTPALGALVWEQLPFVLFASMALLSGTLGLLTPETNGCPLPDTMEEAVNIGKRKPTITNNEVSSL